MNEQTTSPLDAATERDRLPLLETALIGVMIAPTDAAALIRLAGGRIARVVAGDRIDGATVVAIDETGVVLAEGSRTRRLRLPGA